MLQSGSASSEDVDKLRDAHLAHKLKAQMSHSYYTEVNTRCSEEWATIASLEQKEVLSDTEKETFASLKTRFTCIICADYQMGKLVLYWGLSLQPGSPEIEP